MSVVVDFEEKRHHANHERLLRKMFDDATVEHLLSLRSNTSYHLIARVSGYLLGSLVAVPLQGKNKGIVQVLAVAVEPKQRHHRIARGLLRAVVEEARREHHHHVIACGPAAPFRALEWDRVENLEPAIYPVHNYQEDGLPLEAWWSVPTRTFMPKALRKVPDVDGVIRTGLRVLDNVYPTASKLPPLSR